MRANTEQAHWAQTILDIEGTNQNCFLVLLRGNKGGRLVSMSMHRFRFAMLLLPPPAVGPSWASAAGAVRAPPSPVAHPG